MCLDPDLNWGPIPLQGSALPTELSRHIILILNFNFHTLCENATTELFRRY